MYWVGPILGFVGAAGLLYGFRKNNRNILLGAGIILFLAGSLGDFLKGFEAGIVQTPTQADSHSNGDA
jgi:hypothetical protein